MTEHLTTQPKKSELFKNCFVKVAAKDNKKFLSDIEDVEFIPRNKKSSNFFL